MPDIAWCDGFEWQVVSNATGFNAGGYSIGTGNAQNSADTTNKKNGAASLACSPTVSAASGWSRNISGATTRDVVQSFYVRFASSLPSSDLYVATVDGPPSAGQAPIMYLQQSTSKLALAFGTSLNNPQVFGPTIVADTWYLVDWKVDISGATFTHTARVDSAAGTENTTTRAGTPIDITSLRLGTQSSAGPACTFNFDDWVYGYTLGDYPIGPHAVNLLLPTADGTHNGGTNTIEDQTGTDIDGSYTTAYSLIDQIPPATTTQIRQSTSGTGNYAEVTFADPSGTVWASTAWACGNGGSGASDMLFRITDSGGTTVLDQGGSQAMSGAGLRYSAQVIPAPDGTTGLANVKGRVGFADDVSAVPKALSFVIQYAVATGGGPAAEPWSLGIPI